MNILRLLLIVFVAYLYISPAFSEQDIILLTSPGCAKCAAAHRVLSDVVSSYDDVNVREYTYTSEEGQALVKRHKVKDIPSIVIGDHVIGYRDYKGDEEKLKELLALSIQGERITNKTPDTVQDENYAELFESITLSTALTVLAAGLLAGFNPCLLAILTFLATAVIASSGRRRDLIGMIVCFSFGILSIYFIFGIGLFEIMQNSDFNSLLRLALSSLLLLLGAIQIEDARQLRSRGRSLFRTDWILKYFNSAIGARSFVAYFILGVLFSMIKAPCVGAVYIAIISLIYTKGYTSSAVLLLFLYNLGVVLPVVLLGSAIALGMQPESVERFRHEHRVAIRLITGITLIALAPLIYWQII